MDIQPRRQINVIKNRIIPQNLQISLKVIGSLKHTLVPIGVLLAILLRVIHTIATNFAASTQFDLDNGYIILSASRNHASAEFSDRLAPVARPD